MSEQIQRYVPKHEEFSGSYEGMVASDNDDRYGNSYVLHADHLARVLELEQEVERLKGRREYTHEWYARHYGKLQDWARKVLPEEYRTQFFNCVANGLYDPTKDRGEPYRAVGGFMVTPGGYFQMDTAAKQILFDQCVRAEDAEAQLAALQTRLDRIPQALGGNEETWPDR